jgi:AAA domain
MSSFPPLGEFKPQSSKDILSKDSVLAWLIWAPSGYGKTALSGQLNDLTLKFLNKPTLYIPLEASEGGGAATIRERDVPTVIPNNFSEMDKLTRLLYNDKSYGGVVVDSASELAKTIVKPAALQYPCRENTPTRALGVATRSDYQVMGELMGQLLRQLMKLTTHPDPSMRKHLIVTAAEQAREEDDKITWIGPDLPGRMSREAVQMFQQVGTIVIKPEVQQGKRTNVRVLNFSTDGVKQLKDRYKIFPTEMKLRNTDLPPAEGTGEDLVSIYEKYWLGAIGK